MVIYCLDEELDDGVESFVSFVEVEVFESSEEDFAGSGSIFLLPEDRLSFL